MIVPGSALHFKKLAAVPVLQIRSAVEDAKRINDRKIVVEINRLNREWMATSRGIISIDQSAGEGTLPFAQPPRTRKSNLGKQARRKKN